MTQAIEIAGAIIVLIPFALLQAGRMSSRGTDYLVLNVVGSILLVWAAWVEHQWGFLVVEVVWTIVSAINLVRFRASRSQVAAPPEI